MLQEQRLRCSFDAKELSYTVYKTKQEFEEFLKFQKSISNDPILKFDPSNIHIPRKDNMIVHAKKLLRWHQLYDFDPVKKLKDALFFTQQMPLSLHFFMFLRQLKNLCSEQQQKTIFEPAMKGEILGCYAQTQLAHGSDVKKLMTTATFDQETDQFIINTPSIGACKWWVGDLGIFANHALVSAQLIIKGKNFGVHSFLVPIRDKNHNILPNVEVGDIGPKFGYQTKDNGYGIFKNLRIPRQYMLMKFTKVSRTGQYTRSGDQKASYATMLMIRSIIPQACFTAYSKAALIVTRYSLVRSQFKDGNKKQIPLLDYQLQQDKVITKIAEVYALMFGAQKLVQMGGQVVQDAKNGIFTSLNQTHAISSGLKAIFTNDTMAGMQILRRACGGHGFLQYSGLPSLLSETSPAATYEGQNTILLLQTARFILKSLKYIQKGKRLPPTVMYLDELKQNKEYVADYDSPQELMNPQIMRKIFLYQSCVRAKKMAQKLGNLNLEGIEPKQAWDYHSGITLVEAATAHTYFWIYQNFYRQIYLRTENEKIRAVLFKLLTLYGIQKIFQHSQSFFETGVLTASTFSQLQIVKQKFLKELRPQALALVQAFGYDDNTVHSAIGCSDGNVYQRLLDWAKNKNVVNQEPSKNEIKKAMQQALAQLKPKL